MSPGQARPCSWLALCQMPSFYSEGNAGGRCNGHFHSSRLMELPNLPYNACNANAMICFSSRLGERHGQYKICLKMREPPCSIYMFESYCCRIIWPFIMPDLSITLLNQSTAELRKENMQTSSAPVVPLHLFELLHFCLQLVQLLLRLLQFSFRTVLCCMSSHQHWM